MREIEALGAIEFRFTDPDDVKVYSDRWYRYEEEKLIRTPAHELIKLEHELEMPIVDVMNGVRLRTVLGDLGAAWLGVRAADPELAGKFADFNPLVMLIEWRPAVEPEAEEEAEGKDEDQRPSPDAGSPPVASHVPMLIDPTLVVLPSMPPVE